MHIAIAGNIGSGKTTLTKMLAAHYGWTPKFESVDFNPYLADFYEDMERWSFNLQIYFLNKRFKDVVEISKRKEVIIQDRTIYEDARIFAPNLHSMGLMSSRDFENYSDLFDLMMSLVNPPDLLIYLRSSIPNLISRRQFNDRRKKVGSLQEQIRSRMAMEMDGGEDYFCIDSKPIEVCRVARGKRCKMGKTGTFENAPDFGYCASQGIHFYGYKLHVLCGLSGVIHSYDLSKASVHDINYIKDIKHTYHDCSIFGDKGYIGAEVQLDLFETANIRLECPYRLNQKDWKPTFIPFAKARKRVETLFSQLSDQFLVISSGAPG